MKCVYRGKVSWNVCGGEYGDEGCCVRVNKLINGLYQHMCCKAVLDMVNCIEKQYFYLFHIKHILFAVILQHITGLTTLNIFHHNIW